MTIYEHLTFFAGYTIVDWEQDDTLMNQATLGFAIRLDWDTSENGTLWTDVLADFLNAPGSDKVEALVVGAWDFVNRGDSERLVEALVSARQRLPALKALFIGDITSEENEISWIRQSDMSPLFAAYPNLEHFGVRGNEGLMLGTLKHDHLKTLIVQTGGLDVEIVRSVVRAQLPKLEHLELWLGTEHYGWNGTIDDVKPLLYQNPFPALRYLGLRDSEIVDEIAAEIVKSPVLKQLETLDLSLGTLADRGAEHLVNSPDILHLKKLDLHHHYCSDEMIKRLRDLPIKVDVSDVQDGNDYQGDEDDDRYVAVSE